MIEILENGVINNVEREYEDGARYLVAGIQLESSHFLTYASISCATHL